MFTYTPAVANYSTTLREYEITAWRQHEGPTDTLSTKLIVVQKKSSSESRCRSKHEMAQSQGTSRTCYGFKDEELRVAASFFSQRYVSRQPCLGSHHIDDSGFGEP